MLCTCGFVLLENMEMGDSAAYVHVKHTQRADTDRSRVLTFLLLRRQ